SCCGMTWSGPWRRGSSGSTPCAPWTRELRSSRECPPARLCPGAATPMERSTGAWTGVWRSWRRRSARFPGRGARNDRPAGMKERIGALIYLFYLFEVGLFLLLVPWSSLWEGNYFVTEIPLLREFCLSPFTRGAVSGVGFLHLLAGVVDSLSFIREERR